MQKKIRGISSIYICAPSFTIFSAVEEWAFLWKMPSFGFFFGPQERELKPQVACKLLIGCIVRRVQDRNNRCRNDNYTPSRSLSSQSSSLSFLSSPIDSSDNSSSSESTTEKGDLSLYFGSTCRSKSATEAISCAQSVNRCDKDENLGCGEWFESSVTESREMEKKKGSETRKWPELNHSERANEDLSPNLFEDSSSSLSTNASTNRFRCCSETYSDTSFCSSVNSSSLCNCSSSTLPYDNGSCVIFQESEVLSERRRMIRSKLIPLCPTSFSSSSVTANSISTRVSPFLLANIASFMTSPDTTLLLVSRRTIQTVESIGDAFVEGEVVSRSGRMEDLSEPGSVVGHSHSSGSGGGGNAQFRFLQTNHRHVVAATTEGILIMSPPSLPTSSTLHDEAQEPIAGDQRNEVTKEPLQSSNVHERPVQRLEYEGRGSREADDESTDRIPDAATTRPDVFESRTPLGVGANGSRRSRIIPENTTPTLDAARVLRPSSSSPSNSSFCAPTLLQNSYMQVVGHQQLNHPSELICSMTCSPDGDFVITGFENGSISVYYCYSSVPVSPPAEPKFVSIGASSTSSLKVSMHRLYDFAGHTDAVNKLQLTRKYGDSNSLFGMSGYCGSNRDPYPHHCSIHSTYPFTSSNHHSPLSMSSSSATSLSILFAKATPLLLYSAGHDGRICQWDLEKGMLSHCIHYHERGLLVFEVSFWSGLIAIATHKPMLVVHRVCEKRIVSSASPSHTSEYLASHDEVPSPFHSGDEEEGGAGGHTRGPWMDRVEQSGSGSSSHRMWPVETGSFLMCTYPFPFFTSSPALPMDSTTTSGAGSSPPSSSVPTQEVWYECPRLMLEMETLISGAHDGAITGAKFTNDSEWIVTLGEDEVITLSSIKEPRQTFRCLEGLTRHTCMGLFNVLLSVCIVASPPTSSVIVVLACGSDGTVIQWLVDPRDRRCLYTKKLHAGALISVAVHERIPRRMLYF